MSETNDNNWQKKIEAEWNENPLRVVTVVAFACSAAAKVVNAWSAMKGRRAYARQVNYRIKGR